MRFKNFAIIIIIIVIIIMIIINSIYSARKYI